MNPYIPWRASVLAVVLGLLASFPDGNAYAMDCTPAPWPPRGPLDSSSLIQAAQRQAQNGDPVAGWLLGALYLTGQGVPQDRTIGFRWLDAAARELGPIARTAGSATNISDIELYEMMRNIAEGAMVPLVQQHGQARGIAFYAQAKSLAQVFGGCLDRSPPR